MAARVADPAHGADKEPIPTGTRTWLAPAWRASVQEWQAVELARLGRRITGVIEQPHVRPWATTMHIPTERGAVWFKATGPGPAYEGPLLEVLRDLGVRRVLLPLGVHPTRPWLLFDDAGPTLRASRPDGLGDQDLTAWERILAEYAGLQRFVEGDAAVATILEAGTPDERPERLAGALDRLVADERIWDRVPAGSRAVAEGARHRLARAGAAAVGALASRAAEAGVPPSIQHNDFHGGNIVVGPDGERFFDWGDAVVGHPFATLAGTLASIGRRTGRDPADPVFERLRDAYTEAWTDVAPRGDLAAAVDAARALAPIGKALAWERALIDLAPDEMDGHDGATAQTLVAFAADLDPDP